MNIVCYINKLSLGGAERVMSILANELQARGHYVVLVTDYRMENEYYLSDTVERVILDGDFHGRSKKGAISRTLRRIGQLRRICREHHADILLSFIDDANLRARLATVGIKTKNVISVRVDPNVAYHGKLERLLYRTLYRFTAGCVFQTDDALHWYPQGVQRHSRVIFNPVSDAFYQANGNPGSKRRLVTCGRLAKQKNFAMLIRAFQPIAESFPDVCLDIFGTGALKDELQKQIDSLGLNDRVILQGRCNDVPNTIKDYSCFILSSDYEGLPNALMEAMALGLPVISTDCGGGGARALIDHDINGLLVPCNDAEKMEQAIRYCLTNPDMAKAMGQKAADTAESFSQERIVSKWEAFMLETCGKAVGDRAT